MRSFMSIFFGLFFLMLIVLFVTAIVAGIVKLVHYLNGKPVFTPKKSARKLLLAEFALAAEFLALSFIFSLFALV